MGLTGPTNPGLSGPLRNDNEGVLNIPQRSRTSDSEFCNDLFILTKLTKTR